MDVCSFLFCENFETGSQKPCIVAHPSIRLSWAPATLDVLSEVNFLPRRNTAVSEHHKYEMRTECGYWVRTLGGGRPEDLAGINSSKAWTAGYHRVC
jgi:hypothetical protein